MRRGLRLIEVRLLPRGWGDVLRQLAMFGLAYGGYEVVRWGVGGDGELPSGDATRIINFERGLHVFVEPSVQAWAQNRRVLIDAADWTYLNAHYLVTIGALAYIYLRRNDSFYFVRNMFMIAMGIALIAYAVYPTAPPRLMDAWGFTDSIQQFTGITVEHGPGSALLNLYAAVPSMHVGFAAMIGIPMARLSSRRSIAALWCLYPLLISFVVVATGNHYLTDVVLGGLTAASAALLSDRLLARARPDAWAFGEARA